MKRRGTVAATYVAAALAFGVASLTAASAPRAPVFARPVVAAVAPVPMALAVADVNGDGTTDVVTLGDGAFSVLLGRGDGSFVRRRDYRIAENGEPTSVAIGDLDGDGNPDVVTADAKSGAVSISRNTGGGTFGRQSEYRVGRGANDVAIADLDRDGSLDVITANWAGQTVSTLLNHGDGTFAQKVSYRTARHPLSLAAADVDGDGAADVVVAAAKDEYVSVLLNRGDGTLRPRVDYRVRRPEAVAIGDVIGDRRPDIVVASLTGNLFVLENKGRGTFTLAASPGGVAASAVVVGDLNGDRKPDLAFDSVEDGCDRCVAVLAGKGGGLFELPFFYPTGLDGGAMEGKPRTIGTGDFDGDGRPDLVATGTFHPNGVSVLLARAGARRCIVPDVSGQSVAAARDALRRAHCRVGAMRAFSGTNVPKGSVVDSAPGARTVLPAGSKVALELNSGH